MTKSTDAADFVARARKRLGLTQPQFAERLGLSRHAIIRYERGDPVPQVTVLAIKYLLDRHARNEAKRKKDPPHNSVSA
jgi:transcriptional regulator with XRE-family HTH domain